MTDKPENDRAVAGDNSVNRMRPVNHTTLKSFVERVERLEEEKKTFVDDIRDVYAEAKANGFDVKALRKLVVMRRKDATELRAEQLVLETYCNAIGLDVFG